MWRKKRETGDGLKCEHDGGRLIKFGVRLYPVDSRPELLRRYQRYQCVVCKDFSYRYIETVRIVNNIETKVA